MGYDKSLREDATDVKRGLQVDRRTGKKSFLIRWEPARSAEHAVGSMWARILRPSRYTVRASRAHAILPVTVVGPMLRLLAPFFYRSGRSARLHRYKEDGARKGLKPNCGPDMTRGSLSAASRIWRGSWSSSSSKPLIKRNFCDEFTLRYGFVKIFCI